MHPCITWLLLAITLAALIALNIWHRRSNALMSAEELALEQERDDYDMQVW